MGLSNNCLPHGILIAQLEAYGIDKTSLSLVNDCIGFRKQRTKIGTSYSDWANVTRGIPQGSILGSLRFNIFINGIFLFAENSNICSLNDDKEGFICNSSLALPPALQAPRH